MDELEMACFEIIGCVGGARSQYVEAASLAREGKIEEARAKMDEAGELLAAGHEPHTKLIQRDAAGEGIDMRLILAHAEDQMMAAEVCKIMADQLIAAYDVIFDRIAALESRVDDCLGE